VGALRRATSGSGLTAQFYRVPTRNASLTAAPPRICVAGGGFGGLYTALRLATLAGREPVEITLVDPKERFVFLPLLYELATGDARLWEVAPKYQDLLAGTGIRFVQGSVERVVAPKQRLVVRRTGSAAPEEIEYDRLAVALGSRPRFDMCPGAQEHATPFYSLQDALHLQAWVNEVEASPAGTPRQVFVIGGGYSGVELACNLSRRLGPGRVSTHLVEGSDLILGGALQSSQTASSEALREAGVKVHLSTAVRSVTANAVELGSAWLPADEALEGEEAEGGIIHAADLVLWTAGAQVNPTVSDLGLPINERGAIATESTLQVLGLPSAFALGDAASCIDKSGAVSAPTAQAAFQQADYVGWNLWASLNQEPQLHYRYVPLGEMLSFGSHQGSVSISDMMQLGGPLGGALRRGVYLGRMPTATHATKVGLSWTADVIAQALAGVGPVTDIMTHIARRSAPLGEVASGAQLVMKQLLNSQPK